MEEFGPVILNQLHQSGRLRRLAAEADPAPATSGRCGPRRRLGCSMRVLALRSALSSSRVPPRSTKSAASPFGGASAQSRRKSRFGLTPSFPRRSATWVMCCSPASSRSGQSTIWRSTSGRRLSSEGHPLRTGHGADRRRTEVGATPRPLLAFADDDHGRGTEPVNAVQRQLSSGLPPRPFLAARSLPPHRLRAVRRNSRRT